MKVFLICFIVLSIFFNTLVVCADTTIRRDELADTVMDVYEFVTQEFSIPISEQNTFDDVNGDVTIYGMRILQAKCYGFMSGVGEGKFDPCGNVTRAQLSAVMFRLISRLNQEYSFTQEFNQVQISDLNNVPAWSYEACQYMVDCGIMSLKNGEFLPNECVSCDELQNIKEVIKKIYVPIDDGTRIDFETFINKRQ